MSSLTAEGESAVPQSTSPRRAGKPQLDKQLAASHYVLDFGHVVKGSAKVVRKFRIYNYTNKAVTFRFDRAILEANGLKVWLCVVL